MLINMFVIIEFFLGLSIGGAILWLTVLGLSRFTRRVLAGEQWQDALKDLWRPALSPNTNTADASSNVPESNPSASDKGDSKEKD
jgi:hypothetical protein